MPVAHLNSESMIIVQSATNSGKKKKRGSNKKKRGPSTLRPLLQEPPVSLDTSFPNKILEYVQYCSIKSIIIK